MHYHAYKEYSTCVDELGPLLCVLHYCSGEFFCLKIHTVIFIFISPFLFPLYIKLVNSICDSSKSRVKSKVYSLGELVSLQGGSFVNLKKQNFYRHMKLERYGALASDFSSLNHAFFSRHPSVSQYMCCT